MRDIAQIMRSGYVTRWHSNPDMAHIRESLAEHHARVAQIILAYHPSPSLDLIDAALHHDCGEMRVGDVCAEAKQSDFGLSAALDATEARSLAEMGLTLKLKGNDGLWLRFADRMAAYLHVKHYRPELLRGDGWPQAVHRLMAMARQLEIPWDDPSGE